MLLYRFIGNNDAIYVYGLPSNQEPKIERVSPTYAYDISDKRAVVGFADLTFVGIVEQELKTEQRHLTETDTIPYTIYNIKVLKNIKGELPVGESIVVAKFGGLTENKKVLILSEGDSLLMDGKIYIFNIHIKKDGSYKLGGAHCSVMLEDSINTAYASGTWDPSILDNSELVKEYEDAFKNQLDFPDDLRS